MAGCSSTGIAYAVRWLQATAANAARRTAIGDAAAPDSATVANDSTAAASNAAPEASDGFVIAL